MCRIKIGHSYFHSPPHTHSYRAADTDRRRYPWGTFISLTPSRSIFCWLEADSLVNSGESLERLCLCYGHTFTFSNSSTWANLHFISACLHSSVETHMHVEKKAAPHWVRKDFVSSFRHINVASLSMCCWWLHAGLQLGHQPLFDWIYGCGSPFPISADWLGANLSRQTFAEDKGGCGRRPVTNWNICDSLGHIRMLHFNRFIQCLLRVYYACKFYSSLN